MFIDALVLFFVFERPFGIDSLENIRIEPSIINII